jgi:hypothetical protein
MKIINKKYHVGYQNLKRTPHNNRYTPMPAKPNAQSSICWHVKYSVALLATEEKNRKKQTNVESKPTQSESHK